MSRVDVYNSDYTALNHAYIQIYNSYERLLDVEDSDSEVMDVMGRILMAFNPVLDKIKSEMTVQTRFKDYYSDSDDKKTTKNKGPIILHGNFTGE